MQSQPGGSSSISRACGLCVFVCLGNEIVVAGAVTGNCRLIRMFLCQESKLFQTVVYVKSVVLRQFRRLILEGTMLCNGG